jgi:hypothetical protein
MKKLGVETQADWYRVTPADLIEQGGITFVLHHKRNMMKLCSTIYPGICDVYGCT